MPSEFDTLIRELCCFQAPQPVGKQMFKALPAVRETLAMPGLSTRDMKRLAANLEVMTKSLSTESAALVRRKRAAPEQFLKSLTALNERIGESIAAGRLTAHEACVLTAKLHHLVERARPHLVAGGR